MAEVTGDLQFSLVGVADANPYDNDTITPILSGVQVVSEALKNSAASGSAGGFVTTASPNSDLISSSVEMAAGHPSGDPLGPALLDDSNNGYYLRCSFSETRIYIVNAGSIGTQIGGASNGDANALDAVTLEIDQATGTIISRKNGTQLESITDTTYNTGLKAGFLSQFLNDNSAGIKSWAADGYVSGPVLNAPASASPGETIQFSCPDFVPTSATLSDGTSTLALGSIASVSGDNYSAVVPALPAAGGSLQYTTFGAVTMSATDGTSTAEDTTILSAADGQTVTILGATFSTAETSYLFNFGETPAQGDQFIEGSTNLALDDAGGYVADTDDTYTITGIDATDGIAQSYNLIVGEIADIIGGFTRRNLTSRAITSRAMTRRSMTS